MEELLEGRSLESFTVAELRNELKKRRQSTVGKKKDLVERLSMAIVHPTIDEDELEHDENAAEDRPITPARPYDILQEENPTRRSSRAERYSAKKGLEDDLSFLSEDGDRVEQFTARRSSAIRRSVYRKLGLNDSFITPDRGANQEEPVSMRTRSHSREKTHSISPSRSRLREPLSTKRRSSSLSNTPIGKPPASSKTTASVTRTGRIADRFAAQHKKLLESQPTLEEARDKVQRRHLEHTQNFSSAVKRLATPKFQAAASRLPVKVEKDNTDGFKFVPNTNLQDFKFGQTAPEDFAHIPKQKTSIIPKAVARPASLTTKQDVKEMSKKPRIVRRPLTQPIDKTMINFLATPKGQTPNRTPTRSGYKPYRGKLPTFTDTSKMSDAQLIEAREAGTLFMLSKQKMSSKMVERNQKKRDELMNAKRKLKM